MSKHFSAVENILSLIKIEDIEEIDAIQAVAIIYSSVYHDNFNIATKQYKFNPVIFLIDKIKTSSEIISNSSNEEEIHKFCEVVLMSYKYLIEWIGNSKESFKQINEEIELNNFNLIGHIIGLSKDDFLPIQLRLKMQATSLEILSINQDYYDIAEDKL